MPIIYHSLYSKIVSLHPFMLRPHHEGAYATGRPPRCFAHMHRFRRIHRCIGAVPRYSSMGSLKFLDQGAILTFANQVPELLRNVPTNFSYSGLWTLKFLHSNEKFKSQRRGDESGAAVHLSNVTEYNNCLLGAHGCSWWRLLPSSRMWHPACATSSVSMSPS